MKKPAFILIIVLCLPFIGCDENNEETFDNVECENKIIPNRPQSYEIDLNNDLISDIRINYGWVTWDGTDSFGDIITAIVTNSIQNEAIEKEKVQIFTVQTNENINNSWDESITKDFEIELISISGTNACWHEEWSFINQNIKDPCFLGVKIKTDNDVWIGWLKLNLDLKSGEVKLVESNMSKDSNIIVGK